MGGLLLHSQSLAHSADPWLDCPAAKRLPMVEIQACFPTQPLDSAPTNRRLELQASGDPCPLLLHGLSCGLLRLAQVPHVMHCTMRASCLTAPSPGAADLPGVSRPRLRLLSCPCWQGHSSEAAACAVCQPSRSCVMRGGRVRQD